MGVLLFLFRYPLISLFTRDRDIVAMAAEVLFIVALLQPFQSSFQVLSGAGCAAGGGNCRGAES